MDSKKNDNAVTNQIKTKAQKLDRYCFKKIEVSHESKRRETEGDNREEGGDEKSPENNME